MIKNFKREEDGLVKGFEYKYQDDGRINWKAHLNVKWLRVKDDKKSELESRYGAKIKDIDLSTVDDFYLYVKLGGYNEVARLRGFDSLEHSVDFVDATKAVVTCKMHFIPNVEEPDGLTCSGVASGSIYNIKSDFAPFMETFAENRAFARCVRRALNINIVAEEELGKGANLPIPGSEPVVIEDSDNLKPYATLEKRCKELNISFDKLKVTANSVKDILQSSPDTWIDWKNIKNIDVWTLLGKINEDKKVSG